MNPDDKFFLRFSPIAAALGAFTERLVVYLLLSNTGAPSVGHRIGDGIDEILVRMVIGALVVPMFMVLVDINRQHHIRLIATSFALGAIWIQPWNKIVEIAEGMMQGATG